MTMTLEGAGLDAQVLVAKWLDLRSLCRLERVSRQMRRVARHKAVFVHLRRVTVAADPADDPYSDLFHYVSTNRAQLFTLKLGPAAQSAAEAAKDDKEQELRISKVELEELLPLFLKHVLERGARVKSLEVTGQAHPYALLYAWDEGVQKDVRTRLAHARVHLHSLLFSQLSLTTPTPRLQHTMDLVRLSADSLRTLALGPVHHIAQRKDAMVCFPLPGPLPNLRHLLLSLPSYAQAEGWVKAFAAQLHLLALYSEQDGQGAKKAKGSAQEKAKAALVAVAAKQRSQLRRVVEEDSSRLLMTAPALKAEELADTDLHSLDLLGSDKDVMEMQVNAANPSMEHFSVFGGGSVGGESFGGVHFHDQDPDEEAMFQHFLRAMGDPGAR